MSLKKLAEIIWKDIKEHSNLVAKEGQPWKEEDNFSKEYSLDPIIQRVVITYDGKQHIADPPDIPSHRTSTAETVQEIEEFLNEYVLKRGLPEKETEVDGG